MEIGKSVCGEESSYTFELLTYLILLVLSIMTSGLTALVHEKV